LLFQQLNWLRSIHAVMLITATCCRYTEYSKVLKKFYVYHNILTNWLLSLKTVHINANFNRHSPFYFYGAPMKISACFLSVRYVKCVSLHDASIFRLSSSVFDVFLHLSPSWVIDLTLVTTVMSQHCQATRNVSRSRSLLFIGRRF